MISAFTAAGICAGSDLEAVARAHFGNGNPGRSFEVFA
jgi:hypothetical protein